LHVTVFSSKAPKDRPEEITVVDLEEQDFPVAITQLLAGRLETQIRAPIGLISGPITVLDIHVFSEKDLSGLRPLLRQNEIAALTYWVAPTRWDADRYELVVDGTKAEFKFAAVRCAGSGRSTAVVRVPAGKEYLYLAVTPFQASRLLSQPTFLAPWKLKGRREPVYPPELLKSAREGFVQVRAPIGPDGRVRLDEGALMECTHRLFGFRALEAIREWRYRYVGEGEPRIGAPIFGVAFKIRRR
jgi:hypothetical protein